MKSLSSSKSGQIRLFTSTSFLPLITGKTCGHDSAVIFDRLQVARTGIKSRVSLKGSDRIICFGIARSLAPIFSIDF